MHRYSPHALEAADEFHIANSVAFSKAARIKSKQELLHASSFESDACQRSERDLAGQMRNLLCQVVRLRVPLIRELLLAALEGVEGRQSVRGVVPERHARDDVVRIPRFNSFST